MPQMKLLTFNALTSDSRLTSLTRRSWVILRYGGPCGADRPRWPWPHAPRSASRYRTWAYRPHRGTRCGCRRGSRCATNAHPPRAPKGHRKRRFQSSQPFGLRAPRATRSIPGASPHSHGERRVLRFECSGTLRLAAVHEPMGAPRAAPCNGGVRHRGDISAGRGRDFRVSRRWSRAVGRGLVVRPPKSPPPVLRQPEEVQLVQRAPWCQQPRRAG